MAKTSDLDTLPNIDGVNELGTSKKVLVHLSKSVLGQGRHIFIDNWYTSVRLADLLFSHKKNDVRDIAHE